MGWVLSQQRAAGPGSGQGSGKGRGDGRPRVSLQGWVEEPPDFLRGLRSYAFSVLKTYFSSFLF